MKSSFLVIYLSKNVRCKYKTVILKFPKPFTRCPSNSNTLIIIQGTIVCRWDFALQVYPSVFFFFFLLPALREAMLCKYYHHSIDFWNWTHAIFIIYSVESCMGNSPYGFKLFKTSVEMCFAYQILGGNAQVAYHLEEKYLETSV